MNTTTDRHSRSYHARQLRASEVSVRDANQCVYALQTVALGGLSDNAYWNDIVRRADELAAEMEEDYEEKISAAIADGFGPEDFA